LKLGRVGEYEQKYRAINILVNKIKIETVIYSKCLCNSCEQKAIQKNEDMFYCSGPVIQDDKNTL